MLEPVLNPVLQAQAQEAVPAAPYARTAERRRYLEGDGGPPAHHAGRDADAPGAAAARWELPPGAHCPVPAA